MQVYVWTKQKVCKIIDAEWEEISEDNVVKAQPSHTVVADLLFIGFVVLLRFIYCWTMQYITGVW